MKRETITLMLNSLDDDYIREAEVFCPESIQENPERIVYMKKKRIITFALAAVLMLALAVTAQKKGNTTGFAIAGKVIALISTILWSVVIVAFILIIFVAMLFAV